MPVCVGMSLRVSCLVALTFGRVAVLLLVGSLVLRQRGQRHVLIFGAVADGGTSRTLVLLLMVLLLLVGALALCLG